MIINNIDVEKKKRGRKKKIVEEVIPIQPVIQPVISSPTNIKNEYYESTFLTKREKKRMIKYGIIGYDSIVEIFDNICKTKSIPNLLIHGESGSGKTYIVNYLLIKLFNLHFKERVLYMSINDERGISTIREKIKSFSNVQVKEHPGIPSVKVIIFDHAEYISLDAQNALRRIIETSNNITRFIFITQNSRCIIDPLLSRCIYLNLSTSTQENRIEKYSHFFPDIPISKINEICKTYNNFGREIYAMETIQIMEETNTDKQIENVISDESCIKLIELFNDNNSKMVDFINFISENMRNVNISLSLNKIYEKIRKHSCHFLEYEMTSNNDSTENIFLLNLFMKCKNKNI